MDTVRPQRVAAGGLAAMAVIVLVAVGASRAGSLTYPVVDTGQVRCFGVGGPIPCPPQGAPLFGQDAQYQGLEPAYRDNGDGTITDINTGLMWQKTPDFEHRIWLEAVRYAQSLSLAGYDDWRLPTIKELFSIADFRGTVHARLPYIDTTYFAFQYPDTRAGYRIIDAQYWSANRYSGFTMSGDESAFGFNFADGRIKSYPVISGRARRPHPGRHVRCVRGPGYGVNDFVDNRDATITDRATSLMWMKGDSGRVMSWGEALAYAEDLDFAGYDDWRLPNVKELQSIVDYSRAPDARNPSDRGPAIDPLFDVTNTESWYWTSTTHIETHNAYYVAFGRALSAWTRNGKQINAHGAGAVRSAPKTGDASQWPHGRGPQGDEVRTRNYVRCVRGGEATLVHAGQPRLQQRKSPGSELPSRGTVDHAHRFIQRFDANGDGMVSRSEFHGPPNHFSMFDRNKDGAIQEEEAPRRPPPFRGRRR